MLKPGENAPDFKLLDENGTEVRLSTVLETGPVAIFFYPKDFTAICTLEACAFRDAHAALAESGLTVFGISADDVATHLRFKEHHQLPYSLLSDPGRKVADLYGAAWSPLRFRSRRATFVIGENQRIVAAYQHELRAQKHVDAVREALRAHKP